MAKRRGLGDTKAKNKLRAEISNNAVRRAIERATSHIQQGNCPAAYMGLVEAFREYGHIEAHERAGGSVWKPSGALTELSSRFESCIRPERIDLELNPITVPPGIFGASRRRDASFAQELCSRIADHTPGSWKKAYQTCLRSKVKGKGRR